MKKFFLIACLFFAPISIFGLEYGYQEVLFNADDYYQKDLFVVDNFYPEMKIQDFLQVYASNIAYSPEKQPNIIHLGIDEKNWSEMMTHYLSDDRFV